MSAFDVIHNALSDGHKTATEQTRSVMDALSRRGMFVVTLPADPAEARALASRLLVAADAAQAEQREREQLAHLKAKYETP